LKEIHIRKVVI